VQFFWRPGLQLGGERSEVSLLFLFAFSCFFPFLYSSFSVVPWVWVCGSVCETVVLPRVCSTSLVLGSNSRLLSLCLHLPHGAGYLARCVKYSPACGCWATPGRGSLP
jgi:hypothetical protein